MTENTTQIPTEPPVTGSEVDTLVGSLERQRRTFRWKCGGLDAAGLRATTAATTMTLGGLLREAIDGLSSARIRRRRWTHRYRIPRRVGV